MNKPIQYQPDVLRDLKHRMLGDWLLKVDITSEVVQGLVVGYCKRNKKAFPEPPLNTE